MPSAAAAAASMPDLPAGFRFHPTDEELVVHYLANQAAGAPCAAPDVIAEANIYACDPWELPVHPAGDAAAERYFFSPRHRKYPNGARPNRAAGGGYWKATGTDRPVLSSATSERVGVKKALVFYSVRPPRGVKTDWIMHEYRLITDTASAGKSATATKRSRGSSSSSSMRLDDWVLCRIYKKSNDAFSSSSLQHLIITDQEQEEASSTVEQEDSSSLATTNNINTAATLASSSACPKSETLDHDGHQFRQTTAAPMSKSCSLTDLLNTIDCSALSQMLLLDGGTPMADAVDEQSLIYYPEAAATSHTHQQSLNCYNNSNNNNVMNDSSSHFISNNLLPPRAVDARSDNNGLVMKRKRTMTAMDGAAVQDHHPWTTIAATRS